MAAICKNEFQNQAIKMRTETEIHWPDFYLKLIKPTSLYIVF